jgi:hypothetical protein
VDDHERRRYLTVYLNDHLAGSTAGAARFARSARAHRGSEVGEVLTRLHAEVEEDRRQLVRWMRVLGVARQWPLQLAGRAGEALGAFKPNGRLVRPSPLRTVVELEGLLLGVEGKAALWRTLRELALTDDRLDPDVFEELVQRADRQSAELEHQRRLAVRDVLARPAADPVH